MSLHRNDFLVPSHQADLAREAREARLARIATEKRTEPSESSSEMPRRAESGLTRLLRTLRRGASLRTEHPSVARSTNRP